MTAETIRVLYFASLREAVGCGEERVAAVGIAAVGDLVARLRARGAPWGAALDAERRLLVAVNRRMATWDAPLKGGDEAAFFPPVTGG